MIGKTIGHYEILALIGRGGMGEVYRARDTRLKRDVALKVLPAEMARDPQRLERFQREAETVAGLNHPHIIHLYSIEEADGVRFLTMELVEGETLDAAISPHGLPLAKVFEIGIAVADALAAAHDKGVIHRDLKPANVMIAKDGRIKVLDFGLAKLGERSPTLDATMTSPVTAEGTVMGTVPYMSPEQLRGQAVDHRSDIFSLGILLYEMSAGRRPFSGNTNSDTTSAILRDTPPLLTQLKPDLPRHLARIVSHCLEKEPDQRIQSARDARNELRGLRKEVESGESTTSEVSAVRPVASGGGKKTLWIGLGAAVAVIAAVAFFAGRGSDKESPDATTTANAKASLAVLPFVNLSDDKSQEYFSDGLTEELLNNLAKIPELNVTGRTSAFAFKGKNEDVRTIGDKLGVEHVLEGSVRKAGDKVRITAQLVKVADGFHLWSETYDRTLDDVFAVQDDIARSVASALQVTLLGKPEEKRAPDAEAYDLILQARYVLGTRSEDYIQRGSDILDRALALAPDYAPAWGEVGLLSLRRMEAALTVSERQQHLEEARKALSRALELDPTLAVAHSRMAGVQRELWDFDEAMRSMQLALEADPNSAIVVGNAALIFAFLGREKEALELYKKAHLLDPLNATTLTNLCGVYMMAGQFDEAESLCRTSLELRPDFPPAIANLGDIALLRGQTEVARATNAKFYEMIGEVEYGRLLTEAFVQHTAGNDAASRAAAEDFEKAYGADEPLLCADIYAWRGETDTAFAWLDKAIARRDPVLSQIKLDYYLKSLHKDPRWNEVLKKIGLPTTSQLTDGT